MLSLKRPLSAVERYGGKGQCRRVHVDAGIHLDPGFVALVMRNFRGMIEGGNIAAAVTLAGAQIAVALLNAAAMVPN